MGRGGASPLQGPFKKTEVFKEFDSKLFRLCGHKQTNSKQTKKGFIVDIQGVGHIKLDRVTWV